jgi:hypothetical protein
MGTIAIVCDLDFEIRGHCKTKTNSTAAHAANQIINKRQLFIAFSLLKPDWSELTRPDPKK